MQDFIDQINRILPLSAESRQVFLAKWQTMTVPKDHFLLREHTISHYLYFTQKGIARIYYYKNDKEITEWFALDKTFFFSIISFFQRQPGTLIIQTIEPADIMYIHYDDLMALCDENHEIEKLFRLMITQSLIMSQHRVDSLQFETAHQRYEKLLSHNPTVVQRIPLSYIASFLGITQETLSRIRSQL